MLVEYAATEMGFLDDYYDADPNHKIIRGNGITVYCFLSKKIIKNKTYKNIKYTATEMGFLDNYSDADPNHKSIRGNGITTFTFHVAQCIIFNLTNSVKIILISNASLKSFIQG